MIFKEHSFVILTFTFMCLQVPALPVHLSSHSELTTTLQKNQTPIPGLQSSAKIVLHCKICKWKFILIVYQRYVILSFGGFSKSSKCTDTSRVINIIFLIPFSYLFLFSSARHEGFPRKQWYCNLVLYITTKCLSLRVSLYLLPFPSS